MAGHKRNPTLEVCMRLYCPLRVITRLRDGDRFELINGGMMITGGKQRKLGKNPVWEPLYPPWNLLEVAGDWTWASEMSVRHLVSWAMPRVVFPGITKWYQQFLLLKLARLPSWVSWFKKTNGNVYMHMENYWQRWHSNRLKRNLVAICASVGRPTNKYQLRG